MTFLADGSATFAKAAGLDLDLTERGMGVRTKRYSMLVDDGVVRRSTSRRRPERRKPPAAKKILEQL